MKTKHFLSQVEHDEIHRAIQRAEENTSGDLILYITQRKAADALAAAHEAFRQLQTKTATNTNSLLIFISPRSHTFAVVGGEALHQKMGQVWWDSLSATLTDYFKKDQFTGGLIAVIEEAGRAFKLHFPATAIDRHGQQDIVED